MQNYAAKKCQTAPGGKRSGLLLLLAVGWWTVAGASPAAHALDWYRWRGPDLNGISRETGWSTAWPAEGPRQLWKANVGTGFSSLAVASGRAYTMGNRDDQDTVYCFDAASGREVWKHTYACKLEAKYYEGGPSATPTVDGDRVFTLSKLGHLFCLDAATGKVIWSKNLKDELSLKVPTWGFASSALVQDNSLFLNVGTRGITLDKASGQVRWATGTDESGYSTPVPFTLGGQNGLVLFAAKAVVAVDPADGKELWSYPWKTSYDVNAADPIVAGDRVFISSGYNRGAACLRMAGGKVALLWENKNMRNQHNNSVLINGVLYGLDGDSNSELKAVDLETGAVKWAHKGLGKGALTAADGKLVVLSEKGELVIAAADPTAYKPLAQAQVLGGKCWTAPVLSNGRIYARNAAGDVVCLDVSGAR